MVDRHRGQVGFMVWTYVGNAILVLLLTLIGVTFVVLVVEIVRDRSFERELTLREHAKPTGYSEFRRADDGYGDSSRGEPPGTH